MIRNLKSHSITIVVNSVLRRPLMLVALCQNNLEIINITKELRCRDVVIIVNALILMFSWCSRTVAMSLTKLRLMHIYNL